MHLYLLFSLAAISFLIYFFVFGNPLSKPRFIGARDREGSNFYKLEELLILNFELIIKFKLVRTGGFQVDLVDCQEKLV